MIRRTVGRWRTVLGAVAALSAVVAIGSCSTGDAADRDRRTTQVYLAVLDVVLDSEPAAAEASDDDDPRSSSTTSTSDAPGSTSSSPPTSSSPSSSSPSSSTSTTSMSSTSSTSTTGGKGHNKKLPLLYVAPLEEGRPFSLEVQAAVIEQMAARAVVRFVDTRQQAVDVKVDAEPTLDDGVLLRLGRVPTQGERIALAAERYLRVDDWVTMRFMVQEDGSSWTASLVERRPRPADA